MGDSAPRHLATPLPLHRRWQLWTGGAALVLAVTAAAWLGTSGDADRAEPSTGGVSAATPPGAGHATTTTGAVATTAAQAADGPKNLLTNASFEDGSAGWQPLGGARLTKTSTAKEGSYSLRISAGPSGDGPIGITVPDVTRTKLRGRYHTNAWVRPSSPDTTVTSGLREYRGG